MKLFDLGMTTVAIISGEASPRSAADSWSIHGQSGFGAHFEKTATSRITGGCGNIILVGETGFETVSQPLQHLVDSTITVWLIPGWAQDGQSGTHTLSWLSRETLASGGIVYAAAQSPSRVQRTRLYSCRIVSRPGESVTIPSFAISWLHQAQKMNILL